MSGVSLNGAPGKPLCEAMKMKPGFHQRFQDAGDVRAVGYQPRRAEDQVWNQPKRDKCIAVMKLQDWRAEAFSNIRHGDAEYGVCLLVFGLALAQYFLTMFPFLPFGIIMYFLCHYMLEKYDLLFDFDFIGGYS